LRQRIRAVEWDVAAILGSTDAFWDFPPAALDRLAGAGRRVIIAAGATLLRDGEVCPALYVIVRGCVALRQRRRDGAEPAYWIERYPTETVPPYGGLDRRRSDYTVRAVEETELLALDPDTVARTLLAHPDQAASALAFLSDKIRDLDALAYAYPDGSRHPDEEESVHV
jgi:CRP-like cAMP-binding protein